MSKTITLESKVDAVANHTHEYSLEEVAVKMREAGCKVEVPTEVFVVGFYRSGSVLEFDPSRNIVNVWDRRAHRDEGKDPDATIGIDKIVEMGKVIEQERGKA